MDHVGIGADLFDDAKTSIVPGPQDPSTYPVLFAELLRRGWSEQDLLKLAGRIHLRAMREMERVAAELQRSTPPSVVEGPAAPERSRPLREFHGPCAFDGSNPLESHCSSSRAFQVGAIAPTSTQSAWRPRPSPRNLVRFLHSRSRSAERSRAPTALLSRRRWQALRRTGEPRARRWDSGARNAGGTPERTEVAQTDASSPAGCDSIESRSLRAIQLLARIAAKLQSPLPSAGAHSSPPGFPSAPQLGPARVGRQRLEVPWCSRVRLGGTRRLARRAIGRTSMPEEPDAPDRSRCRSSGADAREIRAVQSRLGH